MDKHRTLKSQQGIQDQYSKSRCVKQTKPTYRSLPPCPPPIPDCGTNLAIGQRVHSYHSVNTIDSPSLNSDTALIVLSAELNSTEIVRTVGTRSVIGCFGLARV